MGQEWKGLSLWVTGRQTNRQTDRQTDTNGMQADHSNPGSAEKLHCLSSDSYTDKTPIDILYIYNIIYYSIYIFI